MAIIGKVRWVGGIYTNGLENREIWVPKNQAQGLPYTLGVRVPIKIRIGNDEYLGGLRATERNDYVWISPALLDEQGNKTTLAQAFHKVGVVRNQAVVMDVSHFDRNGEREIRITVNPM